MSTIFESLGSLITEPMLKSTAVQVEEKESSVSKAISSVTASILGVLLKGEHKPQVRNILEEAGNLNILKGVSEVFELGPNHEQLKLGDDFLQQLLGDKAADFTDPIAEASGISKVATNRLVSVIAPVVCGFLGNKLVKDKWSMQTLIGKIRDEKDSFQGLIPAGVMSAFGLTSVFKASSATHSQAQKTIRKEPEKKSKSWIGWLLVAIVALLLIFFGWRSCHKHEIESIKPAVTAVADTVKAKTNEVVEKVKSEFALPNNIRLMAYKGGMEERMIHFLNSDEYKNATEEVLKDKWFDFDNIDFIFGSATELTDESYPQLDNIAEILKYYNGAKVKVGGYTDKTGNPEANQKLSEQRAETVKKYLINKGASKGNILIEGYGEAFAKYPASAPDSDRIKDRKISLRFVK